MAGWQDRYPERFEHEVEELRALNFVLDEGALARGALLVMRGAILHKGESVDLEIRYPDSFPFLRPEVYAPTLNLGRHQNMFCFNLCTLDRSTSEWNVDDTGAWLIATRVPLLLDLVAEGGEALLAGEAPQGEPASAFFPSHPGTAIFIPAAMLSLSKTARSGPALLSFSANEPPTRLSVRALLTEASARVKKGKAKLLATADAPLGKHFGTGTSMQIRWARLDTHPSAPTPEAIVAAASKVANSFYDPLWQNVNGGEISVIGVVFEEEVRQGEFENAWLFAVLVKGAEGYVIRGERLSEDDLMARIPRLRPLRQKTIALAGGGAIGGPIAMELARSQLGCLRILDYDQLEVGNTVRWPFGLTAVGFSKEVVLTMALAADHPYVKVETFPRCLGLPRSVEDESELDLLDRFLDGADLLLDATAEDGIQYLLATLAHERGLPQLYAWGTEGAFGGVVARVVPGKSGCWLCLRHLINDGKIKPPFEETGNVQPRGCATPTFTGESFNLAPISAQATRVAARLLTEEEPDIGNDVMVLALTEDDGTPLPAPRWDVITLESRANCSVCGSGASS